MKFKITSIPYLLLILGITIQPSAFSWGPEAHRSIALSAYQILQYDIYEIAKSGEVSYEADLLRGAMDGRAIIENSLPIKTDTQAINAIEYEIQLLRAARKHGVGSHFAYRLGTLAAFIADTMHPFGIVYTPEDQILKEMIDVDIEESIYRDKDMAITGHKNTYIVNVNQFISKKRTFYSEDQVLIRDEYSRGINFKGYAGQANTHYYRRSVEAIIDAWFTIMSPQENSRASRPSDRAVTWYFVNEIGYLLGVRKNIDYANRAYKVYEEVNPGIVESHLTVGDMYYDYGTRESHDKGVEEWVKVQQESGASQRSASTRLSTHYISEGDAYLAHSRTPESMESDLSESLHSYTLALQYDRTNGEAARKISEISVIIQKRKEEYTLQQKYIDSAMLVIQEAEKSRLEKDYGSTLGAYSQSLSLLQLVGDEFHDLLETAKETTSRVKKDMKSSIREVINSANASLESADTAQLNGNFDEAIRSYNAAKNSVSVIRAEPGSVDAQTIEALIESAELGISDSNLGKDRAVKNAGVRPKGL